MMMMMCRRERLTRSPPAFGPRLARNQVYCHVTGHCVIGMKVKINIINGTSSGATHAPKSGDATTARASLGALAAAGVFAALSSSLML